MQNIQELCSLCEKLGCRYRQNEPLKNHTTFKIGGKASLLIDVNSENALVEILKYIRQNNINFFVLGKGSNILADDEGFDGVIIKIANTYSGIEKVNETDIVCLAGTPVVDVCSYALKNSLSGIEFAYGIPGTVGGALYMNAGAYGGEIKDIVKSAHYIDKYGEIRSLSSEEMKLSYRKSIFSESSDMIITDVTLSLTGGVYDEISEKMNDYLNRRKDKQPLNYPSAGSTFKRPQGAFAAALIEECGLKGKSVGDAQVSEKHSGFVVNKGNATFKDVIRLTDEVKKTVFEKTGFNLELEPIILK